MYFYVQILHIFMIMFAKQYLMCSILCHYHHMIFIIYITFNISFIVSIYIYILILYYIIIIRTSIIVSQFCIAHLNCVYKCFHFKVSTFFVQNKALVPKQRGSWLRGFPPDPQGTGRAFWTAGCQPVPKLFPISEPSPRCNQFNGLPTPSQAGCF